MKPKCRAMTTPKGPAPSLIDTLAAADALAKALASEPVCWLCVRAGGAAPISTAAATRRKGASVGLRRRAASISVRLRTRLL